MKEDLLDFLKEQICNFSADDITMDTVELILHILEYDVKDIKEQLCQ